MAELSDKDFDPRFYTEFRYEGKPEDVIADFCGAAKQLLKRLASDLRSTEKGPFGPESTEEYEQMAIGVERITGHLDVFQEMASGKASAPETGRIIRSVVANVLADANAAGVARARAEAPKARQAKFDQGKTGSSVEGMKEYADKIKDLGEGVAKILDNSQMEGMFDIIAAVLEDIAISGAQPAENTGGNEATRQLEEKLDYIMPTVDALQAGQSNAAAALRRIDDQTAHIKGEVDNIEYKAERLGDLLGKTLVGSGWIVRPTTAAINNVIPPVSIKDEMHGMEADLTSIVATLKVQIVDINNVVNILKVFIQFIVNIFPAWVFTFFDASVSGLKATAPGSKPLIDERLKKIFVYAEDRFAPQAASQRRTIDVSTPAFDLSGWIDLSDIRKGDIVEVTTFVTVAGRRRRLDRHRFDQPALLHFADFARGLQYISGSNARIQIRQTASADNFRKPIDVGYQFVVESQ